MRALHALGPCMAMLAKCRALLLGHRNIRDFAACATEPG